MWFIFRAESDQIVGGPFPTEDSAKEKQGLLFDDVDYEVKEVETFQTE